MDPQSSSSTAQAVAESFGQQDKELTLIRRGANDVYSVGELLIRVTDSAVDVGRHLAIGRFLANSRVPVPEVLGAGESCGNSYSVWEFVRADRSNAHDYPALDFNEFGSSVRVLHQLDVSGLGEVELPSISEFGWLDLESNLMLAREADVVSEADLDLLDAQVRRLSGWVDQSQSAAGSVICHGDIHPQNVLMRAGEAVLIDWDTICLGPPQWDHAALMTWSAPWGGRPEAYQEFGAGYGETFESDPLALKLAQVRLLAPTINIISKGAHDGGCATEARLRMQFWRGDNEPATWTAQ